MPKTRATNDDRMRQKTLKFVTDKTERNVNINKNRKIIKKEKYDGA